MSLMLLIRQWPWRPLSAIVAAPASLVPVVLLEYLD
jgi:hypothetical protein